jgi:hypothetical protein
MRLSCLCIRKTEGGRSFFRDEPHDLRSEEAQRGREWECRLRSKVGHPATRSATTSADGGGRASHGLVHIPVSAPELAVQLEHALAVEGGLEEVAERDDLRSSGFAP